MYMFITLLLVVQKELRIYRLVRKAKILMFEKLNNNLRNKKGQTIAK